MGTHGIVTEESGVRRPQPKGRTKFIHLWPRLVSAVLIKLMTMLLPLLTRMGPLLPTTLPLTLTTLDLILGVVVSPKISIVNAKHPKPFLSVRRSLNSARCPKTAIPLPHTQSGVAWWKSDTPAKRKQGCPRVLAKSVTQTDQPSFSSLSADDMSSIKIVISCGYGF
jgi:hypothetical protein